MAALKAALAAAKAAKEKEDDSDDPLGRPVDHLKTLDEDPLQQPVDHLQILDDPPSPKQQRPSSGVLPPSTPTPTKQPSGGGSWLPRWARRNGKSAAAAVASPSSQNAGGGGGSSSSSGGGGSGGGIDEGASGAAEGEGGEANASASFVRRKKRMLLPQALKELDADKKERVTTKSKPLTEQTLYEVIKSFVGYIIFLLIFIIVAFSTRSSDDYWANAAMKQVFVDGPFFFGGITHEKKLEDVHFTGQFFDWLQGPFLQRTSEPELGSPPRFLRGYNRIIGPVRLRQLRVKPGSCGIPAMFKGAIDECYAPYSLFKHDTAPFGPAEAPEKWAHSSSTVLDGLISGGRFATYSGGGYVVDLPTNATAAAEAIEDLRRHGWVDRATRAVFVDMSCYNANTESFLSARLLFEFLPTGGIIPYPILRVLRPLLYTKPSDFLRALFELLFALYVGFYIFQEGRELRHARRQRRMGEYWADKWNILDWCVALLALAVILLRVYVFTRTLQTYTSINSMVTGEEYVNLQPLMFLLQQVQNLNALNALLLFLKVFKYLAIIPQMNLLFGTLAAAGLELLLFSVLFSIVLLGFAMSFYVAFGLDVYGYRSVSASLISLFQFVLGIFDYEELWASNRVLAPLLFGAFAVLVILILMNIFLAIITDAFNIVAERQKATRSLTGLFKALIYKKVLRKQFNAMIDDIGTSKALLSSDELMTKMDINGDAYLDPGELEQLLRQTKLYEHFTVKELIQRFDSDGDGKLSGDEVVQMNEALLRKRRQVDMQLAAQLSPRTRAKVAAIFTSHQVFDNAEDEKAHVGGALYTDELRGAIEEMGYEISDEHLKALMSEFDADGSSALDLLEFTALMARMLGYRELPEEQFKLLRKVFAYVDSDGDGNITPAELRAVVERFGLKMATSQLDAYVREFDADGDGEINLTEFCNLMSKLHGRLGITTNPTMLAKDLQLTVTKLEQLIASNALKANEALHALVAEAKLDVPHLAQGGLASLAGAATAGAASPGGGGAIGAAATAAAVAAAQAKARELTSLASAALKTGAAGNADGAAAAEDGAAADGATVGGAVAPGGGGGGRRGSTGGRRAGGSSLSPPDERLGRAGEANPGCFTSSSDGRGDATPGMGSSRPTSGRHRGGGSPHKRGGGGGERGKSHDGGRGRRRGGSRSPEDRSPHSRERSRERVDGGNGGGSRHRGGGASAKSKPGRSRRGGAGFDSARDLGPLKVAAATAVVGSPGAQGRSSLLAGAGDVPVRGTRPSPQRRPRSTTGSPNGGGKGGVRRRGRSASPTSPGQTLMC